MTNLERLQEDVERLGRQMSQNQLDSQRINDRLTLAERNVQGLQDTQSQTPAAPEANQLWNGELGHSVNTWHDTVYTTDDKSKECAWFYSHDAPVSGQVLVITDARTSSVNNELKAPSHSSYSKNYSDWNSQGGYGRITGTKSFDTPIPGNYATPDIPTYHIAFKIAKRHQFIDIPLTSRLGVGVWDATAGQRDWINGDVGLEVTPRIDGASTVTRKYRLYIETDRGFTILSNEVTVVVPDDGQYNINNYVEMSWHSVAGYLLVQVIEFTPSTGVYRLLEEVSGQSLYVDNGAFLRTIAGYPVATSADRRAVFYSSSGELALINTDGDIWSTYYAPVTIPDNYDMSLTTDRQWVRIFATEACDLLVPGCVTDGTTGVVVPAGAFEANYDAEYDAGTLVAKVYDVDDNLLSTTTLASRTDDTHIVLGAAIAAGVDRKIRIVGGGFHGLLVDKIHAGYHPNTSFAPNPLDSRVLQPVAAPDGSSQGGPGDGGGGPGGGGGIVCVTLDTPVQTAYRDEVLAGELTKFDYLEGENLKPNEVRAFEAGLKFVHLVRTKNGFYKRCSREHRFRMGRYDGVGTALFRLNIGDRVMTRVDGRDELSPIVEIGPPSPVREKVITPRLVNGHYYIAGAWRPKLWQKILIALKLMRPKKGGIFAHNLKIENQL